jgi:hypothetical protein
MFLKCEFELVDDGRENGGKGTGEVVSDNGDMVSIAKNEG